MAVYFAAIDELLLLLNGSEDSAYAVASVDELVDRVESAKSKLQIGDRSGHDDLRGLCAPAGALQDTAIDNCWGDRFISIADRLSWLTIL